MNAREIGTDSLNVSANIDIDCDPKGFETLFVWKEPGQTYIRKMKILIGLGTDSLLVQILILIIRYH